MNSEIGASKVKNLVMIWRKRRGYRGEGCGVGGRLASCPGASLELLVPVGLAQVLTEPALLPGAVTKCHAGRELCASLETSSQASQVFIRSP